MHRTDATEAAASATVRTRGDLEAFALRLLDSAHRHATADHAQVRLPGGIGGYGATVDGLEGFARTFLIAGFVLAGRAGDDPAGLLEWYARGLAAGTDPQGEHRWPRLGEHPQAKVEAASLALILDMTRPWLWESLEPQVQRQIIDYLAPAVGDETYPQINWVWFRLVVQTFLRSVDGPHAVAEMRADLATHDTFARAGGWLADGRERAFDHYAGWALHLYPSLWSRMAGAQDLAAERRDVDRDRLDEFLTTALALVDSDGGPLIQGRSLVYRFAAAAPFWAGAMSGVPSHEPGSLRRAALSVVSHFTRRGVPGPDGLLTLGWFDPWPALAQRYSGPGSPYWAAKGLLGLAMPADHAVWTTDDAPLPLDEADTLLLSEAPGWIVSGTRADGIVRIVNHGTDHAREGSLAGDSPLYARLGYSTRTFPLLDEASWSDPLDNSVVLVDDAGSATHRTGMTTTSMTLIGDDADVAVAASRSLAHWLAPDPEQQQHGSGLTGAPTAAGELAVVSIVKGAWEIRCVRIESLTEAGRSSAVALRIGGWAVPGTDSFVRTNRATAWSADASSTVLCHHPEAVPEVHSRDDATPLGIATVPSVTVRVEAGAPAAWVIAGIGLQGAVTRGDDGTPRTRLTGDLLEVIWPDGERTEVDLHRQVSERGAASLSTTGVLRDPRPTPTLTKEAQ